MFTQPMGYQQARKKENQDIKSYQKNYQYATCLRLSIRSVRMLGKVVYFHKMFKRQEDITGTGTC